MWSSAPVSVGCHSTAAQKVQPAEPARGGWREQVADLTRLSLRLHEQPDDIECKVQRGLLPAGRHGAAALRARGHPGVSSGSSSSCATRTASAGFPRRSRPDYRSRPSSHSAETRWRHLRRPWRAARQWGIERPVPLGAPDRFADASNLHTISTTSAPAFRTRLMPYR